MTIVYIIIGAILSWILTVESMALNMVSTLFEFLMKSVDRNVATFQAVEVGWVTVRDVFNMFFIFFLLIIAFATILRVQNWQYKQLLPRLIIAIILVNFSRTICAFFIEFSNILMRTFNFGLGGRGLTSVLISNLKLDFWSSVKTSFSATSITDVNAAAGLFMLTLFVGVFVLALFAVCVVLITRIVALMFLTIFSPAAFVLNILPRTQEYANKWWSEFLKYIIYGPATTFLVFLAVRFSVGLAQRSPTQTISSGGALKNAITKDADKLNIINNFSFDDFLTFVLVIGFLFGAVLMVRGLGSFGSAALMSAGTAALGAGLGFATKSPVNAIGRSIARGNSGVAGALFKNTAGVAAGLGSGLFNLRPGGKGFGQAFGDTYQASGDAVRFLSPSLMMDAARKSYGEMDAKARSGAAEYVQKPFNKLFRLPTSNNEAVKGHMDTLDAGYQNAASKIGYLKQGVRKGGTIADKDRVQAAFQNLMQTNNLDKLFGAAESDADLRRAMFGSGYEGSADHAANGYKNNIANRIKVMENMFGGDTAKAMVDNMSGAMAGKGAYDWMNMVEYDGDKRQWVGYDSGLDGADLNAFREMKVGMAGAAAAASKGVKDRANLASSTSFDSDGNLGSHEFNRAVHGYHNAGDNQAKWKNMSADRKRANSSAKVIDQRQTNAAFSVLANSAFHGTKVGSHDYSRSNGVNGASWDLTVKKGVENKNNNQIRADFKAEVARLATSTGGRADLEKMLKKADPQYFSNSANLSAAVSQIQTNFSRAGFDSYVDQVVDAA